MDCDGKKWNAMLGVFFMMYKKSNHIILSLLLPISSKGAKWTTDICNEMHQRIQKGILLFIK